MSLAAGGGTAVLAGKIALLDTHDAFATHHRAWSGSSKERRWWMQQKLESLRCRVKLVFIEVIVTDPDVIRAFLTERLEHPDLANRRRSQVGRCLACLLDGDRRQHTNRGRPVRPSRARRAAARGGPPRGRPGVPRLCSGEGGGGGGSRCVWKS